MTTSHTVLSDGAVLRGAEPRDRDSICQLLTDRGESADAMDLELIVDDPDCGWAGVGVVEHDGGVVATATLLDEVLRVGATELSVGQVELVACATSHEHRGYVRALMRWCHALSYTQEHVAQVMIGIPYFYRQFGYGYAIPMHPYAPLLPTASRDSADTELKVRLAGSADISAMADLQCEAQAHFDVATPHQSECWRWLVQRDGSANYVAERQGTIVATGRWTPPEDDVVLVSEVASRDAEATRALLGDIRSDGTVSVRVHNRPHVPGLAELLGADERADWYYVRIEDPGALFSALRPELSRRLSASTLRDADELVELSFWESQLAFTVARGEVGNISTGGPRQVIVSQGGSGLPPDAIASLLFGCGAAGLEDRFPDCYLGDQRELMVQLFPPVSSDLLTFYLPG